MKRTIDQQKKAADLRQRAELVAKKNDHAQEDIGTLSSEDLRQRLYDHQVYQVELEMQNEELRQAQIGLEDAREKYFDLYDLAPVGYCTLSEKGMIQEANLTTAALFGVSRGEMSNRPISMFIHPEDQGLLLRNLKMLVESREQQGCDLRLERKDGTITWIHFLITISKDADGLPACRAVLNDISERKRAESNLAQSHELLSNLARLVPGVVYQYRLYPDGRSAFPYTSPGIKDIYEVTPEEVREDATPVFRRLHPEDAARVSRAIQESARTLQIFHCEFKVLLPRQGLRWRLSQAHPERMPDGSTLWHGIISDISEQKRVETELKEKVVQYHNLADTGLALIWTAGTDKLCIYFNQVWLKFTGRTMEQELGNGWTEGVHPDDFDRCLQTYVAAFEKRESFEMEYRLRHFSGEYRWLQDLGTPSFNSCGVFIGYIGHCFDIHERKRVEAERAARSKRFERQRDILASVATSAAKISGDVEQLSRELTEAISTSFGIHRVGVWLFDEAGTQLVNIDTFDGTTGNHSQGAVLKEDEFQNEFSALKKAKYVDAHEAISDPRVAGYVECYIKPLGITAMLDGLIRFGERSLGTLCLEHVNKPHHWEDDEIAFVCQMADQVAMTILNKEHQQAEAGKDKLEAQLQQAQKLESVGRLAGGVAHDFNNMLGVILGHAELVLEHADLAGSLRHHLEEIFKTATRSAALTQQLLAFARKQTVVPKTIDLNEAVAGLLKMLQRLIGENIHLTYRPEPVLWSVRIDPTQIDQILANLCVNARDAIPGVGKIAIETANCKIDEAACPPHVDYFPGDYVRISVSDTGCGMDKETLSHVFEPFFTTKSVGEGTGLGLATVFGIVKQNRGFINVYSELGKGTTFSIYLPRHLSQPELVLPATADKVIPRGQATILLVEDEPSLMELATLMLTKMGYTVLAAATPGDAIRLAREATGKIHMMLTDVVMPEMNGQDLAKVLLPLNPHLKVLFMSGYTADIIARQGMLDTGVFFIKKPFSRKELAIKVQEVLGGK